MDENTERTPHPEDPAEGAEDIDGAAERTGEADAGDGAPERIPEHNTAPDGQDGAHSPGGAVQGEASGGGSTGGAIQGDASPDRGAPLGGHETTEEQLTADNEVEDDSLKTLDPDDPPA